MENRLEGGTLADRAHGVVAASASPRGASGRKIACVLFQANEERAEVLQMFAEACHRFTPKIALRAGEAVFMEVSFEFLSEAGIAARVKALALRFGRHCQVAFAPTAGEAFAMARRAGQGFKKSGDLPLEALQDYASPFEFNPDLSKKVSHATHTLKRLGVKSISQFQALPSSSLASRFNQETVDLSGRVRGTLAVAWPGFHPSVQVFEEVDLPDSGVEADLQGLVFVLKALIDRSMARLRGLGRRASTVLVRFKLENWSTLKTREREWKVSLPLPQGSAVGLIPILQERLAFDLARQPLEAPVQGMRFEVQESVPGNGAQRDFFSRREEDSEVWNALVARLTVKLGKQKVFLANPVRRYLPERAYERVLEAGSSAGALAVDTRVFPERPARVLKKPEPLERAGDVLIGMSGKRWNVCSWDGPERLSGEWWRDRAQEGFHRDYFRVVTEGGEQLWVFLNRKAKTPTFYLHGFFD